MNLSDFINYRKICPVCDKSLRLIFVSKKRQIFRNSPDNICFLFRMEPSKKGQKIYKVAYNINPNTGSFYVDFYNNKPHELLEESVPLSVIKRYLEFNKNLGKYQFYKFCAHCQCYEYDSQYFILNHKSGYLDDLEIYRETITLNKPINDGYHILRICNVYPSKQTFIYSARTPDKMPIWSLNNFDSPDPVVTSLININFSSKKEDILNKINKLLLFS